MTTSETDERVTIITNNHPRLIMDACELTASEREDFDYLTWSAIEAGEDSASFIRYRGELYDLGDFQYEGGLMKGSSIPGIFAGWHGYISDSFFSGILVRMCEDTDYVIVGRYYS